MLVDKDNKGNPITKCKLVSTVMLSVLSDSPATFGNMEFAGSISKRSEGKKKGSTKDHDLVIKLIGELVE